MYDHALNSNQMIPPYQTEKSTNQYVHLIHVHIY